mmetsp:Transcript_749/g.2263  ORF Transcript_749/g.2263 Transcript_749/m.2263 type:complete len:231 (+) Transcript_749:344-1036(+)
MIELDHLAQSCCKSITLDDTARLQVQGALMSNQGEAQVADLIAILGRATDRSSHFSDANSNHPREFQPAKVIQLGAFPRKVSQRAVDPHLALVGPPSATKLDDREAGQNANVVLPHFCLGQLPDLRVRECEAMRQRLFRNSLRGCACSRPHSSSPGVTTADVACAPCVLFLLELARELLVLGLLLLLALFLLPSRLSRLSLFLFLLRLGRVGACKSRERVIVVPSRRRLP